MSRDSGIEFIVDMKNRSASDLIEALLSNGWSLDDNGQINILPLGDKGEYSWTKMKLTERLHALDIIRKKEASHEIIGVTITWADTNVGCDFLIPKNDTLLFSLTVNRETIKETEFTDVTWYLQKIIPAIYSSGISILCVEWKELV